MERGNQQSEKAFELPQPTHNPEGSPVESGERVFKNVEVDTPAPTTNIQQPQVQTSLPQDQASSNSPHTPTMQVPVKDNPVVAEDVDLIEKEWVDKAKHIVEQTKNDPYLQNKEMSKVKAQYIENRWQKKIKLADDTTQ